MNLQKLFVLSLFAALFAACSDDDDDDLLGNWVKRSDFEGVARCDASAFTIGDKGYVCCGFDGKNKRLSDVWEFDPDRDTWTQMADFGGGVRQGAASFGTDSKGYVGTGYTGSVYLNDFWEFDPALNTWTQIPDFPGTARYGSFGCSLDNMGYIGCGFDNNNLRDFWQYNPNTRQWTQKPSVGGSKRQNAMTFVVDKTIYVVGGVSSGSYISDFWAYNTGTEEWTQMRSISDLSDESYDDKYTSIVRSGGSTFIIDGRAYLAGGKSGSILSTVWEYTPEVDLWTQKTSLEGSAREGSCSFTLKNRGFIFCGRSSSYVFDDVWEFKPWDEENTND